MRKIRFVILVYLIFLALIPVAYSSQVLSAGDTLRKGAARIFIDCEFCDMNYIRQEIPYVNYVRDVKEAQIFVLVTRQPAGSGGTQYTIAYQGLREFTGMNDTLAYTSNPDETSTMIREKRTNLMKMGLMRYVAKTPLNTEIKISHNENLEEERVTDNWNYWVFELSTEPVLEAEEANSDLSVRNSVNISRVTEALKFETQFNQFYNREKFIEFAGTDSAETETYIRSSRRLNILAVKSMGDHWSAGLKSSLGSSTRENYDFFAEVMPAIEFDVFPYSESTHRQLRILYGAGLKYNNYTDTTLFYKKGETLFGQMLGIALQIKKKWGFINLSLEGSNLFHDFSKNRIELMTEISFRIFKGLSLQIDAGIAHINDQLNLRKGDVSEAERLLKLKEIATKYMFDGGIELTYTFGSIYNNVVNPRFGNGRRY